MNQLFSWDETKQWKYNAGYEYSEGARKGGESVKLQQGLKETGDHITFIDQWKRQARGYLGYLQLEYTENSDTRYLHNRFEAQGDFLSACTYLTRQTRPLRENALLKEWRIGDSFRLVERQEDRLRELRGRIHYRHLPEAIAYTQEHPFQYHQRLYGNALHAETRLEYDWGLGTWYQIYGDLKIEGEYEEGVVRNEEGVSQSATEGGVLHLSTRPTLEYLTPRLRWSVGIPIQLSWRRYTARDTTIRLREQEEKRGGWYLFPGVEVTLNYRPNAKWYLLFSSGYEQSDQSQFLDYLLGAYHTSFDRKIVRSTIFTPLLAHYLCESIWSTSGHLLGSLHASLY